METTSPNITARNEPTPFRLLDLPVELRYMVYDHIIVIESKRHVLTRAESKIPDDFWRR